VNSNLYDRKAKLPDDLIKHLKQCFSSVNADTNTEGYNRNEEITKSGVVTYQQVKRIKNWFDGYSGKKEDAPFILNGGDRMKSWCDEVLRVWRDNDSSSKQHKSDGGMQNQFLDSHEKNSFNLGDKHKSTADELKVGSVSEQIKRINKLIKIIS
jgi:hypothetical protein